MFRQVLLRQPIDGAMVPTLRIPWLNIRINTRKLAEGELEVREVKVSQPTLRLQQRRDGTWNLQGLLADPWPVPLVENPPPITIKNGTLELIADEEPSATTRAKSPESPAAELPVSAARGPAILRDVSLKIEGAGGGPRAPQVRGHGPGRRFSSNE